MTVTTLGGDFASRDIDATFLERIAEVPVRAAWFPFIDWPGDPIYAHTGHRHITIDGQLWKAVDPKPVTIEFSGAALEGRAQRCTLGLKGLGFDAANIPEEAAVVGATAEVSIGCYSEDFSSAVLHSRFLGWVETPLSMVERGVESGTVVDLEMELTDGQNPRLQKSRHHAVGTETPGDTAPEMMDSVRNRPPWPA